MNLNEIDYTKPFRFTINTCKTTYTYIPAGNANNCKVHWDAYEDTEAGCTVNYTVEDCKRLINNGSWHYVEGSQKHTLPETFKFQYEGTGTVYTASQDINREYMVTWKGLSGEDKSMAFTNKYVEEALSRGSWNIVEDYTSGETANTLGDFPTCENNVTLESIIAQYAKASAHNIDPLWLPITYSGECNHKHEQQCPNAYANEALKDFTEATGASVSVVNGTYTILYNEACYEAEDDEKLNEIIKCITFLESV